jgi:unsaturated chondroitin disaccharide hydrolase
VDYYLNRLPEDWVPYWDLIFTDGDKQPRDSSSAAIVVCGLLEMSRYPESGFSKKYKELAIKMMVSLIDHYSVKSFEESNGLLLHGTYSNHSPYNTCNHYGVDECTSWGDYFYMEALTRLSTDWEVYW